MSDIPIDRLTFSDLALPTYLLEALKKVGYESPSPIQAQAIPHLLKGLDILGHAPTGTGKTAAFALPLLSRINLEDKRVQVMVLTPTRELAIQVAEAFHTYASHMKGFHVLPIYGGQEYRGQFRALERGVQVVVGTPGRVMDHIKKGTLKLDGLQAMVLDEADEMLRMGFVEEVEWILDQTPKGRQMALFSATMPKAVERIARRHLNKPREVSIKSKTATAETIRQRYWLVGGMHKLEALTRILEVEPFDAILMFVRTKTATTELAEKLAARGFAAAAMNGDLQQKQREQMVERLKKGSLDILVATDVAARGLDVDRISHVVNYDVPYDPEAYIHRIGRTGRAGRTGEAILFISPRERRMFNAIEKATRQKIERLELPTTAAIKKHRMTKLKQRVTETIALGDLDAMRNMVSEYQEEFDTPMVDIAAALAKMTGQEKSITTHVDESFEASKRDARRPRERSFESSRKERGSIQKDSADADKDRYRIAVGAKDGVKPGNIVGAIANEAGLDPEYIGRIEIDKFCSYVDLPKDMPSKVFETLKNAVICGKAMDISRFGKSSEKGKRSIGGKPAKRNSGGSGKPKRSTLAKRKNKSNDVKPKRKKKRLRAKLSTGKAKPKKAKNT